MTLDQFRHVADRALEPFVSLSTRLGITPDAISVLAFVLAAAAGGAYYQAGDAAIWYFAGAVLVALNGWLDILDGAVAREMGTDSKAGDLLDHVLDRYADIVVVTGLAAGLDRYALGLVAVTGVLMTSYLGTQSQAVGLDRVYGGMLGRADRLALIGIVTTVAAFVDISALGFGLVGWLLVVFAVVGHVTALQRFWGAWRALS
ncbi:archaetidylinositol phosphate synthase [Natronoarchaeum philippinense]|uniref:Archaetidylinositol phosphate synthase n=1 Tax=Natronoarchaeum philippinense TaxID=558529 RepID=A0A285N4X0_NATPI|nr:CDP-alcohol phosphatidyltransferase family protein [Natronoarchaeum philippinense]SNZ04524.1 archaetidylinositol phosphate synthase [Natronoarchaeum philippinense]